MTATVLADDVDARLGKPHSKDVPHIVTLNHSDLASWEKRADFLRTQVLVSQGLWPMPEKTPLDPVIHGKIERDAYTIEKVYFRSMSGHYVSGNLYRPKGKSGKLPVVLCPYGHWPDGRFWWRSDEGIAKELASGAETNAVAARSPLQANCAMLASMGCVVFQYDMVGFCDSTTIKHREGFLDAQSILRLQSFMGLQTWNSIRSLDFVLSLPDVDAERVAVTGSSSGGSQTIVLNAVDTRPTVAFPMAMVSMNMQGGCVCENAPLYRVHTNNVELASLFAPKPQGMACGNDWTVDFLTRGYPEMKALWKLYNKDDAVAAEHFNFGHNHNLHSRELQYNFLNKHFKLGLPEPVKEQPFEIVPVKELSVYDAEHPLPNDAADAEQLKSWMTKKADQQLAKLDGPMFAKNVRSAIEAMVADQLPASNDVEFKDGFLSRKGAGERVPAVMTIGNPESTSVTVWAHSGPLAGNRAQKPESVVDLAKHKVIEVVPFLLGSREAIPQRSTAVATTGRSNPNPAYEGYRLGYERSIIAEQAYDILSAIALASADPKAKAIIVVATDDAGPAAVLACAIAGDRVSKTVIDLNHFDFNQIKSDTDPRLLPGALKYGGMAAFVSLLPKDSLIYNAPAGFGARLPGPTIREDQVDVNQIEEWIKD